MKTKSRRLPRKNPYEGWDVNKVIEEAERLERLEPAGRSDRWHRTYRLKWLRKSLFELPEEHRPRQSSGLAARLHALQMGAGVLSVWEDAA